MLNIVLHISQTRVSYEGGFKAAWLRVTTTAEHLLSADPCSRLAHGQSFQCRPFCYSFLPNGCYIPCGSRLRGYFRVARWRTRSAVGRTRGNSGLYSESFFAGGCTTTDLRRSQWRASSLGDDDVRRSLRKTLTQFIREKKERRESRIRALTYRVAGTGT